MICIEHIALWVNNLETMRNFYGTYFQASSGERYHNPVKNFYSYFLSFETGSRLEIMWIPSIVDNQGDISQPVKGLTHIAFRVGSPEQVNALTEQLRADGYAVIGEPRLTGDGYYESVILDPENNRIEITA